MTSRGTFCPTEWNTEELSVETLVPFAKIEVQGVKLEISGCGECILNTKRPTDFGMADYREFQVENDKATLFTGMYFLESGSLLVQQRLKNKTDADMYVEEMGLRSSGNITVRYGTPDEWVLSSLHGDKSGGAYLSEKQLSENEQTQKIFAGFNLPCPELPQDERHTDGGWRVFEESMALFSRKTNCGILVIPINTPEAFLKCAAYVKDGQMKYMEVVSDMSNILIASGQCRSGQDFIFASGDFKVTATHIMENYARYLGCRRDKAMPFGWCSWYSVFSEVKEQDVLGAIEFFADYKQELSPDFIQLDDGYQKSMGDWSPNEKFPNGFSKIVTGINALGARAGIWVAPLIVHESSAVVRQHPDWVARKENGQPAVSMGNWGGQSYALDATNPYAIKFVGDIIRNKLAEGFTYFKIDFNNVYVNGKTAYDKTKTALQAYRNLYRLYRKWLGNDNYLLSCSGFTRGTIGYADGSRIGGDVDAGWNDTPTCVYPGLQQAPIKAIANGVLYACDPDVTHLAVKNDRLTEEQRRIWHSFVCLFGGVEQISELKENLKDGVDQLKILVPPCKQTAMPVFPCADPDNARIGFNVLRSYETYGVYLLWNPDEKATTFKTRLDGQLRQLGEKFHVFSFWDQQYCGVRTADYLIENLGYGEGKLLRFTPVRKGPQIIGTTLHMGMGTNEIEDIRSTEKQYMVMLNDEGAVAGCVYVHYQGNLVLTSATNCDAEISRIGSVHCIHLCNRQGKQSLILHVE